MQEWERRQRERIDRLYDGIRFENVGFAPGPVPSRRRFRRWVQRLEEIGFRVVDEWELERLIKQAGERGEPQDDGR